MRVNCQSNATVQFEVLGRDQREEVLRAALEVMEDPGIDIFNEDALTILRSLGASVEGSRVHIPSHVVRKALLTAPSSLAPRVQEQIQAILADAEARYATSS